VAAQADENDVVGPTNRSRCPSRANASATSGAIGTDRTLPLFGVDSSPFVYDAVTRM
jgi:hypothetical protein